MQQLKVVLRDKLEVYFPYNPDTVRKIRTIPGRKYNKEKKHWVVPFGALNRLIKLFNLTEDNFRDGADKYWRHYIHTLQARNSSIPDISFQFRTKPYKHQKEAFNRCCFFDSYALFLEMGLGKTKVAIDTAAYRYKKGDIEKVLIISPYSVIPVWKKEIIKHCPILPAHIYLIHGTPMSRIKTLKKFIDNDSISFAIINYEGIIIEEIYKFLDKMITDKWMLIFDESTRIKNPQTKRTKIAMRLAEKTFYRLILTGSPITNDWLDIYTQWYIVDLGERFGHNYWEFRNTYFHSDKNGWNWKLKQGKEKKIKEIMNSQSIIITKQDQDAIDLPDKVYESQYIELTKEQRKAYDELKHLYITEIEEQTITAAFILPRLTKLSEITNGFLINENKEVIDFKNNPKMKVLEEIIEDIIKKKKVVIWSRFRYNIEAMANRFKEYNPAILYGDTSSDSGNIVKKFQEDDNCRMFIGNPQSGGLGITLTATDTIIYFNNSFSLEHRMQSEDRSHRIGSEKYQKCLYIDLIAKDTIDEDIIKALKKKKQIADYVMEKGWKNLLIGGEEWK